MVVGLQRLVHGTGLAFHAGCKIKGFVNPLKAIMVPPNQQGLEKEFGTFINLILVASEDDEIKSQLLTISSLPGNARVSLLNRFIEKMNKQNAPSDFIEAVKLLKADDIADQVHKILEQ
jgi:hypothetical protein